MTETESKMLYDQKPKILLESPTFGMMMCSAVRYALGRMTYIVGTTCDFITPLVPYMDMSALQNINKDITEHAEMNELGMDIDREHWLNLRAKIQKEIAFRKE
jgi:hypothetical protein